MLYVLLAMSSPRKKNKETQVAYLCDIGTRDPWNISFKSDGIAFVINSIQIFIHTGDNKGLCKHVLRRAYSHYKSTIDVAKLAGRRPAQKWPHFATFAQQKRNW